MFGHCVRLSRRACSSRINLLEGMLGWPNTSRESVVRRGGKGKGGRAVGRQVAQRKTGWVVRGWTNSSNVDFSGGGIGKYCAGKLRRVYRREVNSRLFVQHERVGLPHSGTCTTTQRRAPLCRPRFSALCDRGGRRRRKRSEETTVVGAILFICVRPKSRKGRWAHRQGKPKD